MNRISFRLGGAALLVCSAFTLVALAADRGFFNPPSTDQKASDVNQQFTSTLNAHRRNTPDETRYDCAEPDTLNAPPCSSLNSERYDLFGFPSSLTALTARYSDPSDPLRFGKPQVSGLNVSGAWKVQRGRPDVTVAVLDTGVRWDKVGLRTQIRLNCKELPAPRNGSGQNLSGSSPGCMESNYRYDINNSGDLDVDDYINDVRVNKNAGPNGVPNAVDGQDLIKAFSNGDDADGNGYVDDIAGWDFFDDDNDPYDASSYFAAANHGTGRAEEAVESGNDGVGNIGICPKCTFMPMRIWDTFVSDANTFGLAVTYAADNGVDVIVGANGSLYHSEFMEAASAYAWSKGLIQTYSGDDLNTGNHNYPAAYNHAMLIEGTVPDTVGLNADNAQTQQARALFCTGPLAGQCPPSNVPVSTYFRSANTAQFGGKSSISMWGSTGSQNTGRAGGAAAIVVSAGLDFFGNGNRLSADEVRIILEQTAEDVTAPNTLGVGNPDPAQPGWDSHFGWGRVDLGKAVQAVREGNIPPEAAIITPDWYAPLVGNSVSLTGIARARHASGGNFHYRVEWGAGQAPTGLPGNPWNLIVEGDASGTLTDLGTVNLAAVRAALATFVVPPDAADATFSPSSPHPLQDQFTVRLTVTVPGKMPGIDRKVLTALPDGQSLVAGYPKRLGSGGEAPIRYADLNGDNIQELIVPAQDGLIHAYQPDGSELKGWPVATATFQSAVKHLDAPVFNSGGVAPPREPPRGPTIADFDGDGKRQLVTAAGLHVYVFNADGSMRAGFPVRGNDSNCTPDKQRQKNLHPKCGFVATPALAWINGRSQPPVIVAPSMDGHLYLWNRDGTPVSWSPRRLQDLTVAAADRQIAESINNPAIGDLDNDGKDDIVIGTNEVYAVAGSGSPTPPAGGPNDVNFLGSLLATETRLYKISGADGSFMGNPIKLGGLIQDVLPFIGPGHDAALLRLAGRYLIVASSTGSGLPGVGSGLATYEVDGRVAMLMRQDGRGAASNITDTSGGLNLFEYAVIGDLLGTGVPAVVKYQIGLGQVVNLLAVSQNVPYNHMIGAWNVQTGANLEAYPTITDDYQFLSSSTIAKMSPTLPTQQILAGTGLGLIHAYDGATGLDIPGFPKITGGWLFAPTAISDRGRMAAITREGFLFEWQTNHPQCQTEWPSFRHDEQGSGNYSRDGSYPSTITDFSAVRAGANVQLQWTAPGDDARCGTVNRYEVLLDGVPVTTGLPSPLVAGSAQSMTLLNVNQNQHVVEVRAVDEVGNRSTVSVAVAGLLPFSFIERTNVAQNVFVTSESVTLSGFTGSLLVAVDNGGQVSINGGAYATGGNILAGQTLRVRHISAADAGTEKVSTVSVGAFSTPFRTITSSQDRIPDAFSFGSINGQEPGALVESVVITLGGYNAATSIIPGPGIEYRLGGAGLWLSGNGTLAVGQSVQVRHTTHVNPLGYAKTYLKIGGVVGYFTSRTK